MTQIRQASLPAAAIGHRWSAMPVLMAATFLIVLDFFVVNVALPLIQAGLDTSSGTVEWVVAGYGLGFATVLITAGRLGDRFGRRRTFSASVALFALASGACGIAPSATLLVVARVVQGLAAALISLNVLAMIGVLYTGAERARAVSVYGIVMGLAAAGGQVVGGSLIDADVAGLGWRAIFLINLPVAALAWALAPRLLPESRAEGAGPIDRTGIALLTAGATALLLPLVEGREEGWPAWRWASLAIGPLVLAALVAHQRWLGRRGRAPLLDPVLFAQRTFRAGLTTQVTYSCTQASFYLVLALYLQEGRSLDALQAGLVFTILAFAYVMTSLRPPALALRYGRDLIGVGALTLLAAFAALAAATEPPAAVAALVPGLVLGGIGQGLCITPLTMTVLGHTDPQRAGSVSGALSTIQQAGNALGVAITGVVFFGALDGGYGHAFELALAQLGAMLVAVVALTRLLPAPAHRAKMTAVA